MTDWVADPRVAQVAVDDLRSYITSKGVDSKRADGATTRFALISLAEETKLDLEPLFANAVPLKVVDNELGENIPPAEAKTKGRHTAWPPVTGGLR